MRVILLVLDALGVGEMPDVASVRPQDLGANTLRSLTQALGLQSLGTQSLGTQSLGNLHLDNLLKLGLGHIANLPGFKTPAVRPDASYGRCRLAHSGADSYLGHQEIMGTIPRPPVKTLMTQAASGIESELIAHGYKVRRPLAGKDLLLVEEFLVIGDNLEADPGLNINLTVATDWIDFERAVKIGQIVRQFVQVARVIVFGGPGINLDDILCRVEERANGQIGIDSPSLGVYNEQLRVQHLGYGVDPQRQAASIISTAGIPVFLIGKMADLIACPGAVCDPVVPTSGVMRAILRAYLAAPQALIAANVQETDLAAHQGNLERLASVLQAADQGLGEILPLMTDEDILIVCADHGNDPLVNIGQHTREETPLLIYQKNNPPVSLGIRDTLADIGATITHLFGQPATQDGQVIIF